MPTAEAMKKIVVSGKVSLYRIAKILKISHTAVYRWSHGKAYPTHKHIRGLMKIARDRAVKIKSDDFYD